MDVNNWEAEVCQCCLVSQEYQKSLSGEHCWIGQKESYEEMLLHVFNITVQSNQKGLRICEDCVDKLRAAASFKKQVLQSQERLLNQIASDSHPKILKKEDSYSEDDNKESFEDTLQDADDNNSIENNDIKAEIVDQDTPTIKEKKHGTRTKSSKILKTKDVKEKTLKSKEKKDTDNPNKTKRLTESLMKDTTLKLVLNSNLTLFDWYKNRYRCFCCKETFLETKLLKKHSKEHNFNIYQENIKRFNVKYYYRAEITDLKCLLCDFNIKNLEDLTKHLIEKHDIKLDTENNLLMPFKLDELQCQVCSISFKSFVNLDHHMSIHYNEYMCDTCGNVFRQKRSLKAHMKTHIKRSFLCKICKLNFESYYKKHRHDLIEHKVEYNNVCPHCPEKFKHYMARLLHLINVHGYEKPQFKCEHCDKCYINNALLRSHVRKVHIQERNFECNICNNKYMRKCELTDHMKSHIQAREFVCSYCGKGFFRRRNLNEHLAIHVEAYRHVCNVCGKTFAQKYNMKMHKKRCQDQKKRKDDSLKCVKE